MPQKVRLPDGTIVEIPDDISPEDLRRFIAGVNTKFGIGMSRASAPAESANPWSSILREEAETGIASLRQPPPDEYGTEAGGTILGSAWEGIKSIPRGARQFGLMALRGAEGLRTPDEDTAREKELRRKLQSLMEEIDPKYRDANLAQLGLGLGQMGAMVGTGFIPIIGKPLAYAGAMAMGAGEQAERMFEYEERTGEDISSGKEKWALAAGLGIGFTEMVPLGKFAPKVNVFSKGAKHKLLQEAAIETGDRWQDVARNIVSTSITQGMEEAAQEAGAGFLQSATGKFLYDDEAMADAGVTALKEGLIGGEVGAVGNALLRLATRGGRAARLRSGWAVRSDSELARTGREETEKLSPEELERKFGAFLTSQTPDAKEMRKGILEGTTLARVERRYAERIEQIKEQTEDGSADQSRQMEVANSDLAAEERRIGERKSAIEKYQRGELRETDEDEVPERAEVINAGEVVNRAQEAQLTEEDAAVIGASNISGSPPQPTFNIHDVLDQIHLRLRPTKAELGISESEAIAESLVESERSLSRQRGLIRRLKQKLKDIPKNIEAQIARRNEINLELEESQAIDPSLTEAQFLELNPDYAAELIEINGLIENAEGDFAKTQQKITTAEASVTKLDGEIKSGRDPAVVEGRVTEAVETFERGEDDVLDVEGRLLTQTQRDNLRLLWGRAKQVVSENGTPVAMPPGATTAQAREAGHTIVNQDVQLTAREARDIVSGIFDGGLAQGVRVGWETSRGRQRTALDWTADISEGDVPTIYQVTESGEQVADLYVVSEEDALEMTDEDLIEARDREKDKEDRADVVVFGEEGAKAYQRAQRISNKTTVDVYGTAYIEANKLIDRMESGLSPKQERLLFGIGETGLNFEELRDLARNAGTYQPSQLAQESDQEIIDSFKHLAGGERAVDDLGVQYALRRVHAEAVKRGITNRDLVEATLGRMTQRYALTGDDISTADAREYLNSRLEAWMQQGPPVGRKQIIAPTKFEEGQEITEEAYNASKAADPAFFAERIVRETPVEIRPTRGMKAEEAKLQTELNEVREQRDIDRVAQQQILDEAGIDRVAYGEALQRGDEGTAFPDVADAMNKALAKAQKNQTTLSRAESALRRLRSAQPQSLSVREEAARRERPELDEGLITGRRAFVDNTKRMEKGTQATPEETRSSRLVSESILSKVLGFRSIIDMSEQQDSWQRDDPTDLDFEELADHIRDPDVEAVWSKFKANDAVLTKEIAEEAMGAKNIEMDVDEFVADTLGKDPADVNWQDMTAGEGQLVMSRIIRTNIQQVEGKSYVAPSTVPAAAGLQILDFFTQKTAKGKYKGWALGTQAKPSNNIKRLKNTTGLSTDQVLDYIDRSLTAGVLTKVKGKVQMATPEQFAATIDERRTAKARETAKIKEELELTGTLRSPEQLEGDAVKLQRARTIMSAFKASAVSRLKRMGHPEAAIRVGIAADSVYAKVKEIVEDPDIVVQSRQYKDGADASVQDHGTMVLFNLSDMQLSYPQKVEEGESDTAYAQRLAKETAFHEGAHLYFIRDDLPIADRNSLYRYGRRQHVPESVNPDNTGPNPLTWRQWVESTYPEYNEAQITEETSVRILDALAKGQISKPKSAGFLTRIKKELEARGRALVGANAEVDISDVMKIFKRLQSGEYDRRKEAVKKRVTGISSAQLLERATAEELQDLKAAAGQGEAALERAARDIVTRVDPDYKPVSLTDSMLDDIRARREMEDTPDFILPIINEVAIEAGDISVAALNEYFAFTDKSKAPHRFLDGTRHMSRHGKRPSERGPGAQRVAETHGDKPREVSPGQDFIEAGHSHELIAGRETVLYIESPADMEESMRYTTGELLRLNFVDKRLSQWKSHLRATREKAMNTLAQVSAIAAWRMHDSALNFLPGILKYGMLSYTNGGFKLDKLYAVDPATNEYRRDSSGDKIPVKGLREILRPILKLGAEMQSDTKNYLVSKRILDVHDRLEQAKQSGDAEQVKKWQAKYDRLNPKKDKKHKYPLDQAQDTINRVDAEAEAGDVDSRAVLQFVQEYADFNYHVIEFAYHSGLLTLDRKLEMQSLSYMPFYKDQGWAQSQPLEGTNNKHYQKGSPTIDKAIEGSWDDIKDDLLGMIVSNVQAITRDGMWNVATQRTIRDEIKNKTAAEVDDYLDPRLEGKAKELREQEINQKKKELDDKLLSDVIVRFKVDGVERKFRVKDPLLVQSIMSVGFSPSQAIEDFFGKVITNEKMRKGLTTLVISPARILRETVTRSPPFIIKNIIRDSWQASVTFGGGPQLLFKSIKYALDPDTLRRAEMHGLGIGVDWSPDPATASAYEMRQMKWDQKSWADPIKFWTIPWAALGQMSRQSEVATRMAIFDKVMETTDGDAAEAAYQATEIMNYGRRGSSQFFSVLTTMAPFMNGRIQGLDVVYRTHIGAADAPGLYDGADAAMFGALTTEQRQKHRAARIATALSRGMLLSMGTLLYYFWVKDEEEYKNAREDQKNDWWLIPIGGKFGVKIPIPFEVGTIYKVIPEQIARAIFEEEHDLRDVRDETKRQIKATLMLDLRPQFIRPIIDAVRNEDVFQRDAIVPQWMEDTVAATEQKNAYTNRMAVMLADALDNVPLVKNLDFLTSPMKLEYMARQYVGTLGAYVMVASDRVVREGWLGTEEMNIVGTSADFGFAADTWVNIPALGDLFYNPRKGGGYQEDFYEVYEEMNKLVSTLGQLEEGRGRKEAQEFKEEHKELFDAKRRLQYFERRMKHYRMERDRLFERGDLSDDDKRRQLFRMFETRDDMLGEMVKIMADIRDERGIMEAVLGTGP